MHELKKILSIIEIFLSYLILITIVKAIINHNDSKADKVLVKAKILNVIAEGSSSGKFDCLIKFKNKEKEMPGASTISKGSYDFIGKTFPAMYSPNKDNLEVLITPKDFKKFKIPFPDSLNWVIPYVLKN